MTETKIKEVLARMIGGDKKSFDTVFLYYYKRIYSFCINHFYSKEDTEELVQDIFVKIWMNRKSIDLNRKFESYLFTIAKHHIINDLRKKINHQVNYESYSDRVAGSKNLVEQEVLFHDLENQIYLAIKSLPDRRQEVFILSRIEGLTNREIAENLNISIKTVETHMKLALDYLRKIFKSQNTRLSTLILIFFLSV